MLDNFKDKIFSVKTNLALDPIDKLDKPDTFKLYKAFKSIENKYDCQSVVFPLVRVLVSQGINDDNFISDIEHIVVTDYDYYNICEELKGILSSDTINYNLVDNIESAERLKFSEDKTFDLKKVPSNYFPYKLNDKQYILLRDFLCIVVKAKDNWINENKRYILLSDFLVRISGRLPYPKQLASLVVEFWSPEEVKGILSSAMYLIKIDIVPELRDKGLLDDYYASSRNNSKCDLITL